MANYNELLKHPKWQRRRLEIMSRADFKCEDCGNDEEMLHVHHLSYNHLKKPWEYDDKELRCLCNSCHETCHDKENKVPKKRITPEEVLTSLEENPSEYGNPDIIRRDCLARIRQREHAKKMRELLILIREAEAQGNKAELIKLLKEQQACLQERHNA